MLQPARRAEICIGDIGVTFVPDGYALLKPTALFQGSTSQTWARYADALDGDGRLPVSIGSFLIRTGDRRILVDLGLGQVDFAVPHLAEFRAGSLLDNLAAEGLTPDDIDTVFYTHLHHDHIGWTTQTAPSPTKSRDGLDPRLTFANARHLVTQDEWEHWQGIEEVIGPDIDVVQEPLANRVEPIADGELIAPGVNALATPGHTPGHSSLVVSAGEQRLVVLGDVMHCQVQVTETHWSFLFDVDADQGRRTREQVLEEVGQGDTIVVAGGHFSGSVFGRVVPPHAGRAWSSLSL